MYNILITYLHRLLLYSVFITLCYTRLYKNANNGLEIRGYIKSRSLLGSKPVDVRCEICDICGNGQMSHRSVCRLVAKFKIRYNHLKDADRQGRPSNIYIQTLHRRNPPNFTERRNIYLEAIGSEDIIIVSNWS